MAWLFGGKTPEVYMEISACYGCHEAGQGKCSKQGGDCFADERKDCLYVKVACQKCACRFDSIECKKMRRFGCDLTGEFLTSQPKGNNVHIITDTECLRQ